MVTHTREQYTLLNDITELTVPPSCTSSYKGSDMPIYKFGLFQCTGAILSGCPSWRHQWLTRVAAGIKLRFAGWPSILLLNLWLLLATAPCIVTCQKLNFQKLIQSSDFIQLSAENTAWTENRSSQISYTMLMKYRMVVIITTAWKLSRMSQSTAC